MVGQEAFSNVFFPQVAYANLFDSKMGECTNISIFAMSDFKLIFIM